MRELAKHSDSEAHCKPDSDTNSYSYSYSYTYANGDAHCDPYGERAFSQERRSASSIFCFFLNFFRLNRGCFGDGPLRGEARWD
jgi:hypothetical protein